MALIFPTGIHGYPQLLRLLRIPRPPQTPLIPPRIAKGTRRTHHTTSRSLFDWMVFGAGCGRCGYDADCEFNPPSGITADHCLILLRALQTCHVDEKAGVIRFLLRYVTSLYSSDQKRVFESCHPPLMHRSNAIRVLLAVPSGWWTGHIDRSSSADIASIPGKQGSITDEGRIAAAKCLLRHALAAHSGDDAGDDGATELNGGDDSLSGALELGKALAAMLKDGDECEDVITVCAHFVHQITAGIDDHAPFAIAHSSGSHAGGGVPNHPDRGAAGDEHAVHAVAETCGARVDG